MNKAELINFLSDECDLTKKQAEDVVEAFVDVVIKTLREGGEVTIAGFGAFMAKTRAARAGVNPQSPNQRIQIPAVVVPKFKAGKTLKDALKTPKSVPMTATLAPAAPPAAPVSPSPAHEMSEARPADAGRSEPTATP